jgi:hypothetical protein
LSDCKHIRVSGTIHVPLPRVEAFTFFTPTGERAYVDGWDPIFPSTVADETEPGTVFQTDHTGAQTTWIVVWRRRGEKIEYARVTPGDRAGIVSVSCSDAGDGTTSARVTYDLTALTPDANAALDQFADDYPDFLERWRQSIAHAIGVERS